MPTDDVLEMFGDSGVIRRERRTVRLADITLNPANADLFPESRQDFESVSTSTAKYGRRHPVEVTPQLMLLDGERRYHDHVDRGDEEVEVVVVHGLEADLDIELYLLDCWSSSRDPSMGERVNLYIRAINLYKEQFGRGQGRPGKQGSNDPGFPWSPERIREEAARVAGLGSPSRAKKAVYAWEYGTDEDREALQSGERSIHAVYTRVHGLRRAAVEESSDAKADAPTRSTSLSAPPPTEGQVLHDAVGETATPETTGETSEVRASTPEAPTPSVETAEPDVETVHHVHGPVTEIDLDDLLTDEDQGGDHTDDREMLSSAPVLDPGGGAISPWGRDTKRAIESEADPNRLTRAALDAMWVAIQALKRLHVVEDEPLHTLVPMVHSTQEKLHDLVADLVVHPDAEREP